MDAVKLYQIFEVCDRLVCGGPKFNFHIKWRSYWNDPRTRGSDGYVDDIIRARRWVR